MQRRPGGGTAWAAVAGEPEVLQAGIVFGRRIQAHLERLDTPVPVPGRDQHARWPGERGIGVPLALAPEDPRHAYQQLGASQLFRQTAQDACSAAQRQ